MRVWQGAIILSSAITAGAAVTVTVSPTAAEVRIGSTKKFYASVSGAADKTVKWFVNEVAGGNATFGTIDAAGLYTAPAGVPPANKVVISAVHSPAAGAPAPAPTGKAVLELLQPIPSITALNPASVNVGAFAVTITGKNFIRSSVVYLGATAARTAFVSDTELRFVAAAVEPAETKVKVTNPGPGAASSSEKYFKIYPPVTVSVSPTARKIRAGDSYDFNAYVGNTANKEVQWAVNGVVGGNAAVGTIDSNGMYTAPLVLPPMPPAVATPMDVAAAQTEPAKETAPEGPQVTITATSKQDPKVSGKSVVTLLNAIPRITAVTPSSITPGPAGISVQGSGFAVGATLTFGGRNFTVVSVLPGLIAAQGQVTPLPGDAAAVQVTNPNPGSAKSNVVVVPLTTGSAVTAQQAGRFLEQATWGPTPELLDRIRREGITPYLNEQLSMGPISQYPAPVPDMSSLTPMRRKFFLNAVTQPDQLRQRMAFALSQLFVVSATTVGNDYQMIPYQRLLHQNAFGNFYDVMRAVTLSPTMGRFLDMVNNAKPNAAKGLASNENYARELLQLFTVGLVKLNPDGSPQRDAQNAPVPAYDEDVIRNLAHVFTGWTYPTRPGATPATGNNPPYWEGDMEPREQFHETSAKVLMDGFTIPAGLSARQDLDAALQHIFNHPNVGPFVSTRLIRNLVTSNPSPAYIARVTAAFNGSGGPRGDLRNVLRAILTDPEAQSSSPVSGHLREPVLFSIALVRALGGTLSEEHSLHSRTSTMGQNLFAPPSVFNYFSPMFRIQNGTLFGPEFQIHNPSASMERANFVHYAVRNSVSGVAIDIANFQALAGDPDLLISAVDRALLYGRMTPGTRTAIRAAIDATTDPRTRARNALYLAAVAGEYQVQH
jgi:hypothetical protein